MPKAIPPRVTVEDVKILEERNRLALQERGTDLDSRIEKFQAAVAAFEMVALKYELLEGRLSQALLPRLTKDGLNGSATSRLIRRLIADKRGFFRTPPNFRARLSTRDALAIGMDASVFLPGLPGGGGSPIPPSDWANWPYDMTGWYGFVSPGPPNVLSPGGFGDWVWDAPSQPWGHDIPLDGSYPNGNYGNYDVDLSSPASTPIDWVRLQAALDAGHGVEVGQWRRGHSAALNPGAADGQVETVWYNFGEDSSLPIPPPWIGDTEPGEPGKVRVLPYVLDPFEQHPLRVDERSYADPQQPSKRRDEHYAIWVDQRVGHAPVLAGGAPDAHAPDRGTKERKFLANIRHDSLVGVLVNQVTEGLGALDALFDAMPDAGKPGFYKLHRRGRARRDGFRDGYMFDNEIWVRRKDANPQEKFQFIYDNYQRLDVKQALINLAKNQVEDAVIGGITRRVQKAARPWLRQSRRPVGFGTGPAM